MTKLPTFYQSFVEAYPACGAAYEDLASATRDASGHDTRTAELLKLALAFGANLEGAVHSHGRRALEAGASPADLRGTALLAITTLGFPRAMAGLSWIEDVIRAGSRPAERAERAPGGEEGEEEKRGTKRKKGKKGKKGRRG